VIDHDKIARLVSAVGKALAANLIEPEQALELLDDCDCLQLIGLREEKENETQAAK
jgi:hypothetical protein